MALFMYDLSKKKLPLSFDSTFKFTYEIQSNHVIRQSLKMYIPTCHTEFARNLKKQIQETHKIDTH